VSEEKGVILVLPVKLRREFFTTQEFHGSD
jgi:hypothetical protein